MNDELRKAAQDVPYPGMREAFESHFGQSWTYSDWRSKTSVWAAAWKAALAKNANAAPEQQPVAWVEVTHSTHENYKFHGIEYLPIGKHNLYTAPVAAQAAQPDLWDGAEEWERLAFELCAEECGEEACNELIWENNEPWGDRWMMYEDEAKRMIQLVRKHTAPPSREWQDLSPLEMRDTLRNCAASTFDKLAPNWYEVRQFARAIEQASRTKNTGER